MKTIPAIFWKEWREQRWKLFYGTAMLLLFTGSMVAARIGSDREIIVAVWILGGLVLSLYSAMGVFGPERADATDLFYISRPVAAWKVFWCKWFFGWLNFAAPMLLCVAVVAVLFKQPTGDDFYELHGTIRGTLGMLLFATIFYSMTCCLAPRRAGPAGVGLAGLVVFALIIMSAMPVVFILPKVFAGESDLNFVQQILCGASPYMLLAASVNGMKMGLWIPLLLAEQCLLLAAVLWIGVRKWRKV